MCGILGKCSSFWARCSRFWVLNVVYFKQTLSDFAHKCLSVANWMKIRANSKRFSVFWVKLCEDVSECVCVCACVWVECVPVWVCECLRQWMNECVNKWVT